MGLKQQGWALIGVLMLFSLNLLFASAWYYAVIMQLKISTVIKQGMTDSWQLQAHIVQVSHRIEQVFPGLDPAPPLKYHSFLADSQNLDDPSGIDVYTLSIKGPAPSALTWQGVVWLRWGESLPSAEGLEIGPYPLSRMDSYLQGPALSVYQRWVSQIMQRQSVFYSIDSQHELVAKNASGKVLAYYPIIAQGKPWLYAADLKSGDWQSVVLVGAGKAWQVYRVVGQHLRLLWQAMAPAQVQKVMVLPIKAWLLVWVVGPHPQILAYDMASGKYLKHWPMKTGASAINGVIHSQGVLIYVGDAKGRIWQLDVNRGLWQLRWRSPDGAPILGPIIESPEGRIYVATQNAADSKLYALYPGKVVLPRQWPGTGKYHIDTGWELSLPKGMEIKDFKLLGNRIWVLGRQGMVDTIWVLNRLSGLVPTQGCFADEPSHNMMHFAATSANKIAIINQQAQLWLQVGDYKWALYPHEFGLQVMWQK